MRRMNPEPLTVAPNFLNLVPSSDKLVACQSFSPVIAKSHTLSYDCDAQSLDMPRYFFARPYFKRSALCTALASALVSFGMVSASAAENSDALYEIAPNALAFDDITTDDQLDRALEALRLRRAVEKGEVDRSVLADFNQRTLQDKNDDAENQSLSQSVANDSRSSRLDNDTGFDVSSEATTNNASDNALLQQATMIQQQGYQMMTPEQIERELAALDEEDLPQSTFDNRSFNNNTSDNSPVDNREVNFASNNNFSDGFNAPVALLNSQRPPIGLDPQLDAANLPTPTNLDTLSEVQTDIDRAETAEIMSRPIEVSDAVSSGRVDTGADITKHRNPEQILAQQGNSSVTGAENTTSEAQIQASTGNIAGLPDSDDEQTQSIDPEDYLPEYQAAETQAVAESVAQSNRAKPLARNEGGIVKRIYNRLFNGGVVTLPRVETTVYLQQAASAETANSALRLIEADEDIQPINNIKAALDDTTVQSVADFTAALPRLRQIALDAAKAVGYYDITLKMRQPDANSIDVIIEKLGEPVKVDSRIVDIRGEGSEQAEFQTLEDSLPPKEGEVFNHRVYKNSKAALEALSNTYGYFDQRWLDKSVDIILPDNTADISLIYDTGARYKFDEVIFFTYDEATGTLTRDPDKLPVELSLLRQLVDFKEGDPFYRPAVTKLTNDLSATRYFNILNVESILPPDERSARSTIAFDNAANTTSTNDLENSDSDNILAGDNSLDNDVISGNEATARNRNPLSDSNDKPANDTENLSARNSGEIVNPADIAPIEFQVDEETQAKLQAIKQKADRLSSLPSDRVLDEKDEKAENFLGKISDSISNIAKKIFPEEKNVIDENFVPPTLANRITPEQVLENKKVPLYVFVSSNKPRDAQVGLGYGTDTGVRATGKIDYNLINRKGYQAGAETEISGIIKNISVYGSRPWKHPLNDKLEARLTYKEEIKDQGKGNFDLSTNTLEARLARNIRNESGWDRSYFVRYRIDELESDKSTDELVDAPVEFASGNPKQRALLLGYGISKTMVDNIINPTRGLRQYYSIEAGAESVLSDTDMAIIRAGASGIYSFGEDDKHQLLGSIDSGYIYAKDFYEVPYNLRFFAGGDQSIRGYDYESLSPIRKGYLTGGQVLAVGSAEYNYEFKPGFRGALFTDVGNAYDRDFKNDTKVGVGVGIRWASPVGVVRVDVAAGVTEDSVPIRLHFFIGSPL